jgi:hypothetical protein
MFADNKSFWGVFWVNVDTPSTAKNDFIAIAKDLGSSAEGAKEALQVLARTKENWLLILDNADDPETNYQDYITPGTYGSILITSRLDDLKHYSPDSTKYLGGLEIKYAKPILLQAAHVDPERWQSHDARTQEAIKTLGSHTLAIIQAGAYIAKKH